MSFCKLWFPQWLPIILKVLLNFLSPQLAPPPSSSPRFLYILLIYLSFLTASQFSLPSTKSSLPLPWLDTDNSLILECSSQNLNFQLCLPEILFVSPSHTVFPPNYASTQWCIFILFSITPFQFILVYPIFLLPTWIIRMPQCTLGIKILSLHLFIAET